ncbi:MAG: hypothetical protein FWE41_00310 [Coriobacteriia bacterium]|nr:hypothetical protein [Coriobacteriia bacterium]MCL2749693.1 hypothetical protein [Coriobacteriia bacterium]
MKSFFVSLGLSWNRRDGVGVPLFASAKSGTPTPSLLFQLRRGGVWLPFRVCVVG